MKVKKYHIVMDGEWVHPKRKGYKLMCCDCGLIHTINFKLVKTAVGNMIYFQPIRDNRATGQARRWRSKYAWKAYPERPKKGGIK